MIALVRSSFGVIWQHAIKRLNDVSRSVNMES